MYSYRTDADKNLVLNEFLYDLKKLTKLSPERYTSINEAVRVCLSKGLLLDRPRRIKTLELQTQLDYTNYRRVKKAPYRNNEKGYASRPYRIYELSEYLEYYTGTDARFINMSHCARYLISLALKDIIKNNAPTS